MNAKEKDGQVQEEASDARQAVQFASRSRSDGSVLYDYRASSQEGLVDQGTSLLSYTPYRRVRSRNTEDTQVIGPFPVRRSDRGVVLVCTNAGICFLEGIDFK